jgi:hypothetical protein
MPEFNCCGLPLDPVSHETMLILAATLTVLCGMVAIIWLTRNTAITRERRGGVTLREDYKGAHQERPWVNVVVAAKAGVTKNIPPNTCVSGFPAQPHDQEMRLQAQIRKDIPLNMSIFTSAMIHHLISQSGWFGIGMLRLEVGR